MLFNVVKHAGVHECRLSLTRSQEETCLQISDEGAGFDLARLEGSSNTRLVLADIRERVEGIGGTLDIRSLPGDIVKVCLEIPEAQIHACYSSPEGSQQESCTCQTNSDQAISPDEIIHIVVADDHEVMREGLVKLLNSEEDLEVVGEASTGAEVIKQVQRLEPDLVIMDFSMPEMAGDQATREIRNRFRNVRVIGLSMFDDNIGASRMIEAGVEAYLPKAGPCDNLLRAIRDRKTARKK